MPISVVKANLVDDAVPVAVPPFAGAFQVPAFISPGRPTNSLLVSAEVLTVAGASTSDGVFDAHLYLYIGAAWILASSMLQVTRGERISLSCGGFEQEDTYAFIQVKNAAGTGGASMVITIEPSAQDSSPRAADGSEKITATIESGEVNLVGPDLADLLPSAAAPSSGQAPPATTTTIGALMRTLNAARTGLETAQSGILGIVSTVLGWINVLPGAQYTAAGITLTDAQVATLTATISGALRVSLADWLGGENTTLELLATKDKPLNVADYCWDVDKSAALEASTITKAAPGVLKCGFIMLDQSLATGNYYLHIHNSTTVPADGALASLLVTPIPIKHTTGTPTLLVVGEEMLGKNGVFASTGISISVSSNVAPFSKTIVGNVTASIWYYK